MTRTNVFATAEQLTNLNAVAKPQPAITLNIPTGSTALQLAHKYALQNGLPEVSGYYGCDLETGEFVSA